MNKEKLAVIGSGIAGLSASFFLSKKFDVHLFEKDDYLGGHARTVTIKENEKLLNIDTGFIVFNNNNYPYLKNFFNFFNIETANSNMSFSLSIKNPDLEYGGSGFKSIFAQKKNIFSLKFLIFIFEIKKLYNDCKNLSFNNEYERMTLEDYLNKKKYSEDVKNLHIYPMVSSIWSSNKYDIKNFPFISFLNFFKNHGLFELKNRPQWKYVKGGSKNYIDKVISKNYFKSEINCKINKIVRENNKIIIYKSTGEKIIFDKLVLAIHPDQSLSILEKPSKIENEILSNFKYTKNEAYLHSDDAFMPNKKSAWSSWNFIGDMRDDDKFSLTYWMNNLQKIKSNKNYFVTINPRVKPKNIYDNTIFEHPIFNLKTIESQKKISLIQGYLNTYYCGSYCGYGFHEDGIQSAAHIASIFGINLPWNIDNKLEKRLYYRK
tara:strand:+ start:3854 stop:5152 length:1299 start_codon:yes stop_codon:yes gene_type:complete